MKPFCASILPLLGTLALACSRNPSPISTEPTTAASASFATTSSGAISMVTRTDEGDVGADGTMDGSTVLTRWFDAHGNATKEVYERTLPPDDTFRATTVYEYNSRGTALGYVREVDNGVDGTIDARYVLTTAETDERGSPVHQVAIYYDGNGVVTFRGDVFNTFDARGRVVSTDWPLTTTYGYDAHDNIVYYQAVVTGGHGPRTITLEYNVHDALVHQEEVAPLNGVERVVSTLSTVAYDAKGYPVQQVIEGFDPAGNPERTTRAITYDAHHNPLTHIDDVDYGADGSIDYRGTSHWEYQGRSDVPFPPADPIAAASRGQTGSPSDPWAVGSVGEVGKRALSRSF